jgi:hypothetical protein
MLSSGRNRRGEQPTEKDIEHRYTKLMRFINPIATTIGKPTIVSQEGENGEPQPFKVSIFGEDWGIPFRAGEKEVYMVAFYLQTGRKYYFNY